MMRALAMRFLRRTRVLTHSIVRSRKNISTQAVNRGVLFIRQYFSRIKMTKKLKQTIKTEPEESLDISEIDTSIVKDSYEEKLNHVSIIANPMASKKLTKKIYKLIKKASKQKTYFRNGLNDVQKHIRKGETGLVVFAGDVTPVEIMCHLPAVCEDKDIPYCYTPSRQDIGTAMGVKRGSLMVLIKEHPEYKDLYDEIKKEMVKLALPM